MPIDPKRPSWWRLPAPSMLLLVFLLSFLPWIEIGCENKVDTKNLLGNLGGRTDATTGATLPSGGKTVLATQSGFQIASGGHTDNHSLGDSQKSNVKGVTLGAPKQLGGDKEGPSAAPLLFLFFVSILAAIVAGFAMPPSRVRILVVGALTGATLIILFIQAVVLGFPAVNDVAKQINNANAAQGMAGLDLVTLFVRYTVWYWLTWALLLGAFVPLVLEEVLKRRQELTKG